MYNVDVGRGTCDCTFFRTNELPCLHAIYLVDSFQGRSTNAKKTCLSPEGVAKYFHAESYIKAYTGITLFLPKFDQKLRIAGVTDAPNRVLPPPQPTPARGRQKINRATTTKNKRTRAGM